MGSNAEGGHHNQSQQSLNVTLVVVVAFVLVYFWKVEFDPWRQQIT